MPDLYNKIFNSIPLHVGETFLELEVREEIAKQIEKTFDDQCNHSWITKSEVKLIDHKFCKKCGQIKCKHN